MNDKDKTPNPDPQRPRFPHWKETEQDLWVDFLEAYSCAMLDSETREEDALARVRMAANLADEAVKEMQYRFWIQRPPHKPRAPRAHTPKRTWRTR